LQRHWSAWAANDLERLFSALAILVLTYVGVAAGNVPGQRFDRAGIAFLGGATMSCSAP
jgi:hypothetical protein